MGISTARGRRGIREKSGEKTSNYVKFRGAGSKSPDRKGAKGDSTKVTLGKRTKTATDHGKGKNTTTFKSQKK